MKNTLFAISIITFIISPCASFAQNFRVPDHYSFDTPEGYHKYDKDIIKCVKWLEKTPPGDDDERVKQAGRFLLEWLTGSPYMRFKENARIDAFMSESQQYRIYYMGGWARYALENDNKPDRVLCTYAAIKTVLKVYKSANGKKDANIEELMDLDSKSKLKDWIQERI